MRKIIKLMEDWRFEIQGASPVTINLPHTWNALDGQDGGDNYLRTEATYTKTFEKPDFDENCDVYLQFEGVNSQATVILNGKEVASHNGGYSAFRVNVTDHLEKENTLTVRVDNSKNDSVYPQKADFTFYGGIYRDISLVTVSKKRFDMDYYGGDGIAITAKPIDNYTKGRVDIKCYHNCNSENVLVTLIDANGKEIASKTGDDITFEIENVNLWDGTGSPYLYTARAQIVTDGAVSDEVSSRFGVRDFYVDAKRGFFLNGKQYLLRGVCRHQDRKGIGNAITRDMHLEDMELIREIGANTIRLAHYQHDRYFYDLCDEYGMIVWAEIPYISEHLPNGRENTVSQMKELIIQNYNHPSIVTWGLSNEITISTKDKKDMLDNHRVLNDLCHKMDKTRFTTLACYAMCGPFNKVAHISDVVSWNLYLGWYVPGLFLNDLWVDFFHFVYPNRALGYSEYGAEGMPNLHSSKPRIGDHSEEYQAKYHEYLIRFINKRPWMWATHVWNMFDFAADARDQGGEPGMNHKGLVTFDRKTKKDSFYLYKAYWSDEPFVHICSKRYKNRTENKIEIKVYSNCKTVTLFVNGKEYETKSADRVFSFRVPLENTIGVRAVSGEYSDDAEFCKVSQPDISYKLKKSKKTGGNWV